MKGKKLVTTLQILPKEQCINKLKTYSLTPNKIKAFFTFAGKMYERKTFYPDVKPKLTNEARQ